MDFTEVYNFADDITFFARGKDVGYLINRLGHDSSLGIKWFQNNYMKLNESVIYCWTQVRKYLGKNLRML